MNNLNEKSYWASPLRFAGELENRFLDDYYSNSILLCRLGLAASLLLYMAFGILDTYVFPDSQDMVWLVRYLLVTPLYFTVFLLSFSPFFKKIMQPAVAIGVIVAGLGIVAIIEAANSNEIGQLLYFGGLILVPMVGYSFLRLRFVYATSANLIVAAAYLIAEIFYGRIFTHEAGLPIFISNCFFIFSANMAGMATCYGLEYFARRAFLSQYLLDQERAGEQRKREQTEAMLRVLSQAIGGVVHDLGNPLVSVQTGVQVLGMLIDEGVTDRHRLAKFVDIVNGGAEMLNCLRLSLIEQTRVLEGKPIPVDLQSVSVRKLVEKSSRYQKPGFVSGRQVTINGEEIDIQADEMKLITVIMNLIDNALKYSDGEVRIVWELRDEMIDIAVLDCGRNGRGISAAQASQLFVAFGRLEAQAAIEGTGLGLLSARKIVEAHGGEVFIQGHTDGTPDSPYFSTASQGRSLAMPAGFRTAFVVSCPHLRLLQDFNEFEARAYDPITDPRVFDSLASSTISGGDSPFHFPPYARAH